MKYRVGIWEEISGYIDVEAKNSAEAEELAATLLEENGCDRLFYPVRERDGELYQYKGYCTHGAQDIVDCEELK